MRVCTGKIQDQFRLELVRISAIVDARFSVIVDGVSSRSWTRRDARKRGNNVPQTSGSMCTGNSREAVFWFLNSGIGIFI